MEIFKSWSDDIPQQFQGKEKISILIGAFAKQMEEVLQVFTELETKTSLETAEGQNLDYTGSIAAMSRKDAHIVLRKNHNVEITDDVYRKVLLWKLIKNTSDCTYEDIMGAMSILWNTENISYIEDPKRPATIILKMPESGIDGADLGIGRVLSIKPAGVGVIYSVSYYIVIMMHGLEVMDVVRIIMRTGICFWGCELLDGTNLLDSSRLLDSKRRYDLRLGLAFLMSLGLDYLDGSLKLDGSHHLDNEKRYSQNLYVIFSYRLKADKLGNTGKISTNLIVTTDFENEQWYGHETSIRVLSAIEVSESIGNTKVINHKNTYYFDGSVIVDGSRLLNAFYKEEEI